MGPQTVHRTVLLAGCRRLWWRQSRTWSAGVRLDRHRHRIRQHVPDRRAGRRACDEAAQLVLRGVALHGVADPDLLEAVADVAVETEQSVQVDVAFQLGGD